MADEPRKKALIELLERGRQEELHVWDRASQADRRAQGKPDAWELKDVAAHVAEWKDRDASRLDRARMGETPEQVSDFDVVNAGIFDAHRGKSWDEVMTFEARAFRHLVATVGAFTQAELFEATGHEWTSGRSLAWYAAFAGYQHPQGHLSEMLIKAGDLQGAEEMQRRIVEEMNAVDDAPRARGTNLYNLACFYALHDMPEKALNCLSESFGLRPDLKDWSKQDPDLDSLRAIPEFRALSQS